MREVPARITVDDEQLSSEEFESMEPPKLKRGRRSAVLASVTRKDSTWKPLKSAKRSHFPHLSSKTDSVDTKWSDKKGLHKQGSKPKMSKGKGRKRILLSKTSDMSAVIPGTNDDSFSNTNTLPGVPKPGALPNKNTMPSTVSIINNNINIYLNIFINISI